LISPVIIKQRGDPSEAELGMVEVMFLTMNSRTMNSSISRF